MHDLRLLPQNIHASTMRKRKYSKIREKNEIQHLLQNYEISQAGKCDGHSNL